MANPQERLLEKLKAGTPYGVAVAFQRTVTSNDQDGQTWRLLAGDVDGTAEVQASLSDTSRHELAGDVDATMVEAAIERRSAGFPIESRLDDLAAAEIVLGAADLRA